MRGRIRINHGQILKGVRMVRQGWQPHGDPAKIHGTGLALVRRHDWALNPVVDARSQSRIVAEIEGDGSPWIDAGRRGR